MYPNIILKSLVYLSVMSSIMGAWQITYGLNFHAYEIFSILFIVSFILMGIINTKGIFLIDRTIKQYALFYVVWFVVKILSYIGLIHYYLGSIPQAPISQYLKGVLHHLFVLILFCCLGILISMITRKDRHRIAWAFVSIALASCLYQFISVYLLVSHQIDLDSILWPAISINLPEDILFLSDFRIGDPSIAVSLFRSGGLCINSNTFAAVLICVIPFLLLYAIRNTHKIVILFCLIAMVSLVMTMSRSGLLGTAAALLALFVLEHGIIIRRFKLPILLISSILLTCAVVFRDYIAVFYLRGSGQFFTSSGREVLNEFSQETVTKYPFGIGFNNAPVVLDQNGIALITGPDLHNAWLNIFVEQGVTGLIFFISFSIFIMVSSGSRSDMFSRSLFCSYVGLTINGFVNNDIMIFPIQLFITLFFFTGALEYRDISLKSSKSIQNDFVFKDGLAYKSQISVCRKSLEIA